MQVKGDDDVRALVRDALARKLSMAGHGPQEIGNGTNLIGLGLIDSTDLLDIILEVEGQCGREFSPEGIELENGLTFETLVGAFTAGT